MAGIDFVGAGIWGFLVGFVSWESSLRLIEPLTRWLLGKPPHGVAVQTVGRILVMIFLLWSVLLLLLLVPLVVVAARDVPANNAHWRNLFGAAFIGSWLGAAVLGFMKRASDAGD